MARAEAEAVRAMQAAEEEAKLMEAMGKAAAALQERARQLLPGVVQRTAAGAGGDDGQGEPEEQLQKTFMDMSRSREVFKHFADGGELNRDALKEALQMLGHDTVNEEWVDAIIKDKFSDRSFLDQYDFSKFLAEYEACHMDYVRMRFTEADVDSSGKVDAQELAQVLRKAGMTPVTGVVPQLIAEVCGPRVTEVNFMNFAKILGILRYRLGFTQEEYSDIATSFKRLDRPLPSSRNLGSACRISSVLG
ncbi:Cetn4 [Symbiodinium sp. CCMP2592]|nr:Cetn4 [Symbiodinium sp. CCMP2592]